VGTTGVYTPTCKTIAATTTCGSIWFLGQRRFRIVRIPIRRGETAQPMLTAEIHCALRLYVDVQGEDRRGSRADQLTKRETASDGEAWDVTARRYVEKALSRVQDAEQNRTTLTGGSLTGRARLGGKHSNSVSSVSTGAARNGQLQQR